MTEQDWDIPEDLDDLFKSDRKVYSISDPDFPGSNSFAMQLFLNNLVGLRSDNIVLDDGTQVVLQNPEYPYKLQIDAGGGGDFHLHQFDITRIYNKRKEMKVTEYTNVPQGKENDDFIEIKEHKVKGVLDKIIVILNKGPAATRKMALRYIELEKVIDEAKTERDKLNKDIKDNITELFTAEAQVLTRVLQTAEYTATLSKEYYSNKKEHIDYDAIFAELSNKLTPELVQMMENIKEKYTVIDDAQKISAKLTLKTTKESVLSEGLSNRISDWVKTTVHQFSLKMHFALEDYDAHLERMKSMH